ncbi:MAG: transposase [Spirochaetales bacterium]|nr:transposase [Spirochaetales bacterium]
MTLSERERKRMEIQEFRLSVIAELGNPYLEPGEINRLIREKANRSYNIPYSTRTRIGRSCIKKWYLKFKKYGKEGLLQKTRTDFGICRSLTAEEQDILLNRLEGKPELNATTVVNELIKEGKLSGQIPSSTLSRLVLSARLGKKQRRRKIAEEKNLKFDFFYPLECIQADCMHGFHIPDEKGKMRKAILLAFIDDATRRILYAMWVKREVSTEFEKGIKHILKAHGRIGALYVDNGSTFVSRQTKRILDILQIPLFHSTPRRPQGRGKIERYFRTFREQFLRPLDQKSIKSFEDLNMRTRSWIETEYHRSPHKGLGGKTPLDMWLEKSKYIITLDPTIDLDFTFLHEIKRKVYKDNTFTLHGILYEVPVTLAGATVKLLYDPFLPVLRPLVYFEGMLQGDARVVDSYANTKVRRNKVTRNDCTPACSPVNSEENTKGNISVKSSLAASKSLTNDMEEK